MLQFGLRLGLRPRQLITTTPRPIALIKRLLADPRTAVTRAATHANAAHLSPAFLDEVLARYAGTRLGRQEIDGEIIEDRTDALWTRAMIEAARVPEAPPLLRARGRGRSAGLGAARLGRLRHRGGRASPRTARSTCWRMPRVQRLAPHGWASAAVALYRRLRPTWWSPKVNQGGDMVRAVLQQIDPAVPVKHGARDARQMAARRAGGGAATRRAGSSTSIRRCRRWRTRCATSASTGCRRGASPDRLDALVWAVTELMKHGTGPRITVL